MYGGHMTYRVHIDAPFAETPHMPASNVGKASLSKAKFLHLKSWKNN